MALVVEQLGRQPLVDGKLQDCVDVLIYGPSRVGKTYLSATAPGKSYIATADPSGHRSVPFAIDGSVVRTRDDIKNIIAGFYEGGHGYNNLIADSLHAWFQIYEREIGEEFHKRGAADPHNPPIQARKTMNNQFLATIRALIDLTVHPDPARQVNVIFNTIDLRQEVDPDEDDTDDGLDSEVRTSPYFGGAKLNFAATATFTSVLYLKHPGTRLEGEDGPGAIDPTRWVLATNYKGTLAGDRTGAFPPFATDLDLSDYLKG